MSEPHVTTNNKPRFLWLWAELPPHLQKEVSDDGEGRLRFFFYKGILYDLDDFYVFSPPDPKWDGYSCQSVWDAIYVKLKGSESVIVGHAKW